MILTSELLAPYRENDSNRCVKSVSDLPDHYFTSTMDVFGWTPTTRRERYYEANPPGAVMLLAFMSSIPLLSPGREWIGVLHRGGEDGNDTVRMVGTRLQLRSEVVDAANSIAREGWFADGGHFTRDEMIMSRLMWYVAALERIGVDCQCTWRYLTESVYPVDATQENLQSLAADAPDLDSIASWGTRVHARYTPDPVIFFLTKSSEWPSAR